MRQMIKGLLAALAVATVGVAPAAACGWGGCCGGYGSPCAQIYAPVYAHNPCGTCGTNWAYERLAEPETQYYYVNQGPTYSGPGAFAPYGAYHEEALPTWRYGHRHGYRHHGRHRHHYGYHRWSGDCACWGHPPARRYY